MNVKIPKIVRLRSPCSCITTRTIVDPAHSHKNRPSRKTFPASYRPYSSRPHYSAGAVRPPARFAETSCRDSPTRSRQPCWLVDVVVGPCPRPGPPSAAHPNRSLRIVCSGSPAGRQPSAGAAAAGASAAAAPSGGGAWRVYGAHHRSPRQRTRGTGKHSPPSENTPAGADASFVTCDSPLSRSVCEDACSVAMLSTSNDVRPL